MNSSFTRNDDIFPKTRWSRIWHLRSDNSRADAALEEVCQAYWSPVHAFITRRTGDAGSAMDLTQDYFASLIHRDYLSRADENSGRLRAFLLADIKFFLSNAARSQNALKRGGGALLLHLEGDALEAELGSDPEGDHIFDHQYALELLGKAREAVASEYQASERGSLFAALSPWIGKPAVHTDFEAMAAAGLLPSANAAKTALSRLRSRISQAIRALVVETLADPADLEDELRYLRMAAASGRSGG